MCSTAFLTRFCLRETGGDRRLKHRVCVCVCVCECALGVLRCVCVCVLGLRRLPVGFWDGSSTGVVREEQKKREKIRIKKLSNDEMNGIMNKKIEPNEQQKKRIPGFTEGRKNQVTAGIEPKEIQYGSNNI